MTELMDDKLRGERFGQLFEFFGNGYLEYIALTEYYLGIEPKDDNNTSENNIENNVYQTLFSSQNISEENSNIKSELLQSLKLYKLNYQRMVKLRRNYAEWRIKMERVSTNSINDNNNFSSFSFSSRPSTFNLFSFSRFCSKCSSSTQKLYSSKKYLAASSCEIQKIGQKTDNYLKNKNNNNSGKTYFIGKSQSLFDLTDNNNKVEQNNSKQFLEDPKESLRTIIAEMTAIEAETCEMLGRLQFNIQAIIGFARICTGDVFEVSIRHGHQRWRTRGKTQPDKSQRWDQQPPIASIHVLWNVPVTVRVMEIGFLRARCLSERQFDPAKFAAVQPQLVTMNLNSSGSLKLRLIVTWLPLLCSKSPPQLHHLKENLFNNNVSPSEYNLQNFSQRPEPLSQNSASNGKLRQHQSQIVINNNSQKRQQQNGGSIWRTTSSNSSPSSLLLQHTINNKTCINEQTNDVHPSSEQSTSSLISSSTILENGPVTKVCLRDKKRQREQRLKLGASVGAALGNVGGISRESSKTEKDRWRCSSTTTLLDDVYKDLSKSIPTIDDLSALHSSKSGSICGGSLGHSNNAFADPSSSSSISEGRGTRSGGAKRIFSFVKRGGNDKSSLDKMTASEWRKSVSLAQIPQSKSLEIEQKGSKKNQGKEVDEPEEPEEFNENVRKEKGVRPKSVFYPPEPYATFDPQYYSSNRQVNNEIKKEFESALQTVDALLDMIECLRVYLAKLRSSEFTELVSFEAAMLNWEACLKLNRSGILCQLDNFSENNNNNKNRQNSLQLKKQQKQLLATGNIINPSSTLFSNENRINSQQNSPSTASEDDGCCIAGTSTSAIRYEPRQYILDHISENDSGIDSLRQYQSPYNSYASSAKQLQQNQNNERNSGIISSQMKERRKSLMLTEGENEENNEENLKNFNKEKRVGGTKRIVTATGSAQMDACLAIHLDGARQPLEIICQVQASPFEYTMTKMLYRMEGIETIALESMLGLLQDLLAQCQSNPQNFLLQLGLQFQLQKCWLSSCKNEEEFLLVSASTLREKLRPLCDPIVRNHYPKLVEKVLDSLFSLLIDTQNIRKKQTTQLPITIFQFISLFRGKQFSAFIENLSHEAWITTNLQSGLPSAIRDVMGRLRNVPVVPPLESLRYIGLVLAEQHQELYSPIEKYLRKASPELALDLSACFMCLLEHENEASRRGACRALALLGSETALVCLDFLSHSDCNKSVRKEAEQSSLRIRKLILLKNESEKQQIVTKI